MTDRDLVAQARALNAAATPGPWEADIDHEAVATERDLEMICSTAAVNNRNESDAIFIATSRSLLPLLATELEAEREKVAELQAKVDGSQSGIAYSMQMDEASHWRKESFRQAALNARLVAALRTLMDEASEMDLSLHDEFGVGPYEEATVLIETRVLLAEVLLAELGDTP